MLIFNPLFETLLLGAAIRFCTYIGLGARSVVIAAIAIALMHSIQTPIWGLTVFCFFLVQAYAFYLIQGFARAYWIAAISHALHNGSLLLALH